MEEVGQVQNGIFVRKTKAMGQLRLFHRHSLHNNRRLVERGKAAGQGEGLRETVQYRDEREHHQGLPASAPVSYTHYPARHSAPLPLESP